MPEYEYRCKKCSKSFIVERSMTDSSATTCIECGGSDLSRVWNATFISGQSTGAKSSAGSSTEMCATNPAKPKNCCPCS